LFGSTYLATFWLLGYVSRFTFRQPVYLFALISATAATSFTNAVIESGRWRIGFFVAPRFIAKELAIGVAFAVLLIGGIDLAILLFSDLRHVRGNGFPWRELWIVFLPAALQEEIVFRGYVFQRVRAWNRVVAVVGSATVFALLHSGNRGISPVAMANLVLAGFMLALAYERYERLWFPIGMHVAWNVASGPILGYDVSGYVPSQTLLRTIGDGNPLLTGGVFGVEGSAAATLFEIVAVLLLAAANAKCRMQNAK
jgi:membrane protease YdiL (CAAX protease family)